MNNHKVWFVTGASKGLGLSLVRRLLLEGYCVAATSRSAAGLVKAVGEHDNFLALEVDLTDESAVKQAVTKIISRFNGLDAVVNNAGYGLFGAIEELTLTQLKDEFNVNVFATMNVIRQVLPPMRKQRSGHIFNVTSIAGWKGDTGVSAYNSSKYAIEGLTDALAGELAPLGIRITAIAPGPFRTAFLTEGSAVTATPDIDDYAHIHAIREAIDRNLNGKQLGDPEKAPDVFIRLFEDPNPPVHILMGSDAVRIVTSQLQRLQAGIEKWKEVSESTDLTAMSSD